MWQRVTGAVAVCALAVCALAGCSLIFPFDVEQDGDGGVQPDRGAREGGADGPPMDNGGPHEDVSTPSEGLPLIDGAKPSCAKPCTYPTWCTEKTTVAVSGKLNDVWGSGSGDLWAVGEQGTVLRYNPDGCTWKPADLTKGLSTSEQLAVQGSTLFGVWGDSGAVYAVGSSETILRWNGSAWTLDRHAAADPTNPPATLMAVGGAAGTQILAVGTEGKAFGLVGSSWVPWGTNSTNVLTGVSARTASSTGSGSGAVYVSGYFGELLFNDSLSGSALEPMKASDCGSSLHWQDVWASPTVPASPASELVVIADSGEVLRYHSTANGGKCTLDTKLKKLLTSGQVLHAVGGADADDLWSVGSLGLVGRAVKGTWAKMIQGATGVTLHGVAVLTSPRWVVAVGDSGTIIRTTY